ncbi:MAG: hypothetical protein ACRDOO_29420 [Actinomadura sp.]
MSRRYTTGCPPGDFGDRLVCVQPEGIDVLAVTLVIVFAEVDA